MKQGYTEPRDSSGVAPMHSKAALEAAAKKKATGLSNAEIAPSDKKNSTFELKYENEPDTETEWIRMHPFDNEQYEQIQLWVDWETQESDVITVWESSTPMRVHNRLVSLYLLPHDVDAVEFKEFYNSDIRPLLQEMGKGFESVWDGSNWIGQFECDYDDELEVQDVINGAPTHDVQVFSSISDSFVDDSDLVENLLLEKIDFSTIDLNKRENIEKIREILEADNEAEYLMNDKDFQRELINIQEYWNEED